MSRRILVVEDDPDTADYVLKGLREEGFTGRARRPTAATASTCRLGRAASTPSSWTGWSRAWTGSAS